LPITELSLAVVGAAHPNKDGGNRRSEIMFCSPGEPIELRPEPKNPVDPQAVAVLSARGFQIGYLTAERAPWIGGMLSAGAPVVAIFQQETPYGALIRTNLQGEHPTLPGRTEPAESEHDEADWDPDFYPDEEAPPDFL
jgi:hypothetical protein